MLPSARWFANGLLALCLTAPAAPSLAQSEGSAPPQRPSDGLYQRGAPGAGSNTERLTLTLGVVGAHDERGAVELLGPERALGGASGELSSALAYSRPLRKAVFEANAAGGWRHHEAMAQTFASSYSAGAGITGPISRRATLGANASFVASPYYAFSPLPIPAGPLPFPVETPSRDQAVSTRRFQSFGGGAALTRQVGRYGRFAFRAEARRSSIEDDPARRLDTEGAVDYHHQAGASTTLRAGYGFRYGESRSPVEHHYTRVHDSTLGLTYRWQRTPTRRTTFSFSAGPSMVVEAKRERLGWQAEGNVMHMIGRSWTLSGSYRRGVRFVPGFEEPFLADAGTVSLEGLIGERWLLTLSGGAAAGDVGLLQVSGRRVVTQTGSTVLQYAVSRHVALFGSYVYYAYRFGGDVALPGLELSDLSRSGLRLGITLWVPLLSRAGHGSR